jgi:hypothetical protein
MHWLSPFYLVPGAPNRKITPDSSGYFFVYDFDGVNIAHATMKELQGQNLNDYTDSIGLYPARAACRQGSKPGDCRNFNLTFSNMSQISKISCFSHF